MNSTGYTVQINTADYTELQKLQGIGRSLAERIIVYRETHGDFDDAEQLARVTGISRNQAKHLSKAIDWSSSNEIPARPPWLLPTLMGAAILVLLLLGPLTKEIASQIGRFNGSSTATISLTINMAALLLTFGSTVLAFFWGVGPYLSGSKGRVIPASLIFTVLAFMVLLVACLLGFWLLPVSADFPSHGLRVIPLLLTVVFIVYMLYGPQLIYHATQDPRRLVTAARLFDFSLLPLVFAVLALCLVESGFIEYGLVESGFVKGGNLIIFHLFLLWSGTMFTVQGFLLARKGSCFRESLQALIPKDESAGLRTSIQLISNANPATISSISAGRVVLAAGGIVVLYAGVQLLGRFLTWA